MKSKETKAASKEAKAAQATSSYEHRDIVLAKVRGFPPWPGMVVNPDDVPASVTKEKPTGKKTKFYCIRFFPAGDHAWVLPKDISKLQKHEIEAYIAEPYRKSSDLMKGYKIALDPTEWERDIAEGIQEAADAAADAEVDELEGESEAGDDEPKKGKKRKRDAAPAKKKEKKSKDESAPESAAKKKKASGGVRKAGGKSKTLVESEDEGAAADEASTAPPTKRPKHAEDDEDGDEASKQVKGWRHKLQKSLLVKDKKPSNDDMPELNELFTKIEQYGMSLEQLSFSKIGKVMRHIAKLDEIPRDEEFHFRARAQTLVDAWAKMAAAPTANGSAATNGAQKSEAKADTVGDLTMEVDAAGEPDAKADADGEADAEGEKVNGVADVPAATETATLVETALADATMVEAEKAEA